ncbi:MAG: response regulator [Patescibacteria group bacterium]|nr:response regulator [Patescibacteria group bacterium]
MKKILIIEDEEYLSDIYKIKFEQEGYQVIIAYDGEAGIKLAISRQPDLILLDLVMPKMDGYQVLKKLKSENKTRDIKIYILSNLAQNSEIGKGFNNGANGYFVKANLTPSQLVENIKEIFSGRIMGIKKPRGVFIPCRAEAADNKKVQSKSIKILLIEDEEAIINMYKLSFEKAGFEVEVAKNGAWGLRLARQKPFDAIIMDIVMPAMDGCEAIKNLKTDPKTKEMPVIILSNSAQDNDITQAKECGAVSYLLKSQITPANLVKEIKKVLSKSNKAIK